MVRIQKVQDPIYEISDTWVDALNVYSTAYEEGTLSMEPVPHGRFDNNAIDMGISPPAEDSGNQSPKQYYIPAPHEFAPPARGNRVYVVLKGEAVGIFSTWYALHFFNFSQNLYVDLLGIKSLSVYRKSRTKPSTSSARTGKMLYLCTEKPSTKVNWSYFPFEGGSSMSQLIMNLRSASI